MWNKEQKHVKNKFQAWLRKKKMKETVYSCEAFPLPWEPTNKVKVQNKGIVGNFQGNQWLIIKIL